MPTTIYDSSLLTQRRGAKATSGSFINRITNPINPQTGSAPLLGISQQSIINAVRVGNMPFFRKNDGGCTTIDNGCPCLPLPVPRQRLYPDPAFNGWFRVTTKSCLSAPLFDPTTTAAGYDPYILDLSSDFCKYVYFDSVSQYPNIVVRFYPQMYDEAFEALYREQVYEVCVNNSGVLLWQYAPYTYSFSASAALNYLNSLQSFLSYFIVQNINQIVANIAYLPTQQAINYSIAILERMPSPPTTIPYDAATPISTPLEMWNYYSNQLLENYGLYNPNGTTPTADDSYFQTVSAQQTLKTAYEAGVTYTYDIDHIVASTVGQVNSGYGPCSPSGLTRIHLPEMHYITEGSTITISGLTGDWAALNGTHTNLIPYSFAYNPIEAGSDHIDQGSLPKYAYGFCLIFDSSTFSQEATECDIGWATDWNTDSTPTVSVTHHVTDLMSYAEWVGAMFAYHRQAFGTTEHAFFTYLIKDDTSPEEGVPLDNWGDTAYITWFAGKQQFMPTIGGVPGVSLFYTSIDDLSTIWIPADHYNIIDTMTALTNSTYGLQVAENYCESLNRLWYKFGGSYTVATNDERALIRQEQIDICTLYGIGEASTIEFSHNEKYSGAPDADYYAFGTAPGEDQDLGLNFFNFGIIKAALTGEKKVGYVSLSSSLPWINELAALIYYGAFFPNGKDYNFQINLPTYFAGLWAQPLGYIMRWFASEGCTDIIVDNASNTGGFSEWIAQHFGENRYAINKTSIFQNDVATQNSPLQQIGSLQTYSETISPLEELPCTFINNEYGDNSVWNTGQMVLLQSESDYSAGNIIRFLCIGNDQDDNISPVVGMKLKVLGSFKGYFGGASIGLQFIPNSNPPSLNDTVLYSAICGECPAQNEYNIKTNGDNTPLNNIQPYTEVSANTYAALKGTGEAWICSLEDLVYQDFGFCTNTRAQITGDTRAAPDTTDFTTWRYAYLEGAITEINLTW